MLVNICGPGRPTTTLMTKTKGRASKFIEDCAPCAKQQYRPTGTPREP